MGLIQELHNQQYGEKMGYILTGLRKLGLVLAVLVTGPYVHTEWGYEYQDPGMNQIDLIGAVMISGLVLAGAFALILAIVAFLGRRYRIKRIWVFDLVIFVPFFALAIYAGLSAKIVDLT
jgi:hypothetical protein